MRLIRFFFVALGLLPFNDAKGQILPQTVNQENVDFSVKIIDEFMNRFNNEPGVLAGYPEFDQIPVAEQRTQLILSLFDRHSVFAPHILKAFLDQVINTGSQLRYEGDRWYAKQRCDVQVGGQLHTIDIFLRVEAVNQGHKWVIFNVDAPTLKQSKPVGKNFGPMDHGIYFSGLDEIHENTSEISNYFSSKMKRDDLTIFYEQLKAGNLKILSRKELSFHFNQVDGFEFSVKEIYRNNKNSGWLIVKLEAI